MKVTLVLVIVASGLIGCSGGDAPSPAGSAANSGKTYSKTDADKAQPVRGGAGSGK